MIQPCPITVKGQLMLLMLLTTSASKASKASTRSEEHTSELQSHLNLVCRLLLEKKKNTSVDEAHLNNVCRTLVKKKNSHQSNNGHVQACLIDMLQDRGFLTQTAAAQPVRGKPTT